MAEHTLDDYLTGTGLTGLDVRRDDTLQMATLRYFARDGEFAAAVHEVTGLALPQTQEALRSVDGQLILAWRSPTETLCLGSSTRLAQLESVLAAAADGCCVNLSGGLKVVRVKGVRVRDLLCRLGGTASVPRAGEARRSRLADVPVLAVGVGEPQGAPQVLLVVDRAYAPHLQAWIRETVADFVEA